jgi:hypothetical protein
MKILDRKPRDRSRDFRIPDEQTRAARATITRRTGFRVDVRRLDARQQGDLVSLASKQEHGDPLDHDEQRRWETLVEIAADKRGFFAAARGIAAQAAKLREGEIKARRPKPRPLWEEQGAVTLPAVVFDHLANGVLWVDDLAALVYALAQLERGELLSRQARFDGETLVLRRDYGLFAADHDPEGRIGWKETLNNLDRVGWLDVTYQAGEVRIRRGPLAAKVRQGKQ